jgi:ketosteroid isomerase-like protein
MSEENVQIVRDLAESFKQRDHERAFDFYDEEIEWDSTPSADSEVFPSDIVGVFHGHDGVRTFWRRWLSSWTALEFEVEDVLDAGDEVVLLIRNQRQTGRLSGVPTEVPPFGMVFEFRDGKVIRMRHFPSRESALEGAGLGGGPE